MTERLIKPDVRDVTWLLAQLHRRRGELDLLVADKVREAVPDVDADHAPELAAGLPMVVSAVVDRVLDAIGPAHGPAAPLPAVAFEQARRLSRAGVSLTTITRRYLAGSVLLRNFILAEVERSGLPEPQRAVLRQRVTEAVETVLDGVIDGVGDAYMAVTEQAAISRGQRRLELVRAALAGEAVDALELGYEIEDACHVGFVASHACGEAILQLIADLGGHLLEVSAGDQTVWGWLGSDSGFDFGGLSAQKSSVASVVGLGEPAWGAYGFRETHRQAWLAHRLGVHTRRRLVRFSDAPLLASLLNDDGTAAWLVARYVRPLGDDHRGEALRATLRAYFRTGRNVASAAAALGLDEKTVRRRLAKIEDLLGCSMSERHMELAVALDLANVSETNV
jgi:hypothetical protein